MFSVTPSHIIQYLYCPRFTYYEYVLRIPQYEEKYYKVQKGREVHLQKSRQNVGYLRKRIGAVAKELNYYMAIPDLRGEVDEVLVLEDGSMAPLDYKFAKYEGRVYDTYRTQLYCYAYLIGQVFDVPVNRGYLVYTRSQNYLKEIKIDGNALLEIEGAIDGIKQILASETYPKATKYKKRCVNCTYRNICIK